MARNPSLARLLKKWQPRFQLSDWKISASYRGRVKSNGQRVAAYCTWSRPDRTARIVISEPAFEESDFDAELCLVHELHHPVLEEWGMSDEGEDFIEQNSRLLLRIEREKS